MKLRPGSYVQPGPLAEVTRRAPEADPRDVGLSFEDIDTIWQAAERLYLTGTQPALGLCLRRGGQVVLDRTLGYASDNRVATPEDTLFCLFSASKAITAMVVHLLDDRGLLHLDDAVAWHLPEFGVHGKADITLRHILTHRAGIPNLPREHLRPETLADRDLIVRLLCEARPTWRPGRRLAYHPLTGGYIIAEVVRRVTGRDIDTFLKDEILRPLGFRNCSYGVGPEDLHRVADNAWTGLPVLPPGSWMIHRALGVPFLDAVRFSNTPEFQQAVIPAGNIMATANEASRFFQLLLNGGELDGHRIFEPRTVARATAEQTWLELDMTLGVPMRYGMGFILGDDLLSLYGPHTPLAFGHLGFTTVLVWADPERDLSAALLTSGKGLFTPEQVDLYRLVRTISARLKT